ncbi:Mo-dependent nitrogenase C-terminal domain-containing protein [Leptolyngbya sp. AN03gr2]|uniref:Mo-dependent nitrogenase C-terminal domain-containing protein n=1 Tax=unclassified Leptolyngbya TaxID=2650499 RepID=UPI003D319A3C
MSFVRSLNHYVSSLPVANLRFARLICRLIPADCPFERDFKVFGRIWFHVPPLCKLNPLYDGLVALRFQALSFLVDRSSPGAHSSYREGVM